MYLLGSYAFYSTFFLKYEMTIYSSENLIFYVFLIQNSTVEIEIHFTFTPTTFQSQLGRIRRICYSRDWDRRDHHDSLSLRSRGGYVSFSNQEDKLYRSLVGL
jgi:hypothetical protein